MARDLGISDNVRYRWRSEQQQVESQGRTRPGGAGRAERADPAETGTRDAPEGTGWFTTCGGVLREEISMRYRAIHAQDRRDPIRLMCRALSVSAAGSDAWRSRPERT